MVNLLDTSSLLWVLSTPERLSPVAHEAVASGESVLSVASYWEVMIKSRKGLLPISDPVEWWMRVIGLFDAPPLPIRASHVSATSDLPDFHRDPFDRILIAQSIAEGWPLVTSDKQIARYPVQIIW